MIQLYITLISIFNLMSITLKQTNKQVKSIDISIRLRII